MRITPPAEFMLEPVLDAGSSRDAIGLGQAAGPGLNTRHGTILTLEDISVSFDGFKALNNLNLYIGVGELRCIIGPNGAGKTTLFNVLTGVYRPDGGTITYKGRRLHGLAPERIAVVGIVG